MRRHSICMLCLFCMLCSTLRARDVEPIEYLGFLKIPGVGFQTFFKFEDEDPTIREMPFPSGSAYFRWMWKELEPEKGKYNFDLIDGSLARARENGQALEFRVMLEWPRAYGLRNIGIPQWLVDDGVNLRKTDCEGDHYSPDLDDPIIREYHDKLIRALGERYDGHPDLGSVDIGSVGLWGEWHEYCAPHLMPSTSGMKHIIDVYYESFPNTPLVALVGKRTLPDNSSNLLHYAVMHHGHGRAAWRGDCWGDAFKPGWDHHEARYHPAHNEMPDAWTTGIVALESCGVMSGWNPDAIAAIVDDALAWHVTLAHNKSSKIPGRFKRDVERLVMKMGFRLVLRKVTYPDGIRPGSAPSIFMEWENLGVAPPYRDHRVAFRLNDGLGNCAAVRISKQSIRGWLPGSTSVGVSFSVPADLAEGEYRLETGLVFHNAMDRTVPIAIEGRTHDGWYALGKIVVGR